MVARVILRQLMVKNVGRFWRSDLVFWGSPGRKGRLLGRSQDARRGPVADFWEQTGLYALYAGYKLVYVGQTDRRGLGKRLKDHRADDLSGRWDRFSWFGFRHVDREGRLSKAPASRYVSMKTVFDHMEAVLIEVAEPPMNGQTGRFGDRVRWFEQVPAPEPSDPNIDSIQRGISDIRLRLDELTRTPSK